MVWRPGIFVVEDSTAIRAVLTKVLLGRGHDVLVARDAAEAIGMLEILSGSIDLAIVDAVLPPPGSAAVLEAVRHRMRPVRVLVISGWGEAAVRNSGFIASIEHEPGFRYLDKPFSLDALDECVDELLAHTEDSIDVATGEWPIP